MTTEGQDILRVFQDLRKLFEQVGLLLSTADQIMGEAGWEPKAGNTCLYESSAALYAPKQWMPYYLFRLFRQSSG